MVNLVTENKQHAKKPTFDTTGDIPCNLKSLVCQDTSDVTEASVCETAEYKNAWIPTTNNWTSGKQSEPLPAAALSPCDWMSIIAETVQCHSNSDVPSTHSSDTWLVATAWEDTAYQPSCSGRLHAHTAYHRSEIKMYLLKSFSLWLMQTCFTSCLVTVHLPAWASSS